MQIFIIYDKTYTLNIDDIKDLKTLKERISKKINLPEKYQSLIYQSKLLRDDIPLSEYNLQHGSNIFVNTRLFGGNFVSTGNLIVMQIISLILYYISFPAVFHLLEYILFDSQLTQPSKSDMISAFFSNWNIIKKQNKPYVLNNILNENTSPLLFMYLFSTFVVWFFYTATITIVFYSYYVCQNKKPDGLTIAYLIASFMLYIGAYFLLSFLGNWGKFPYNQFVKEYSVAIYIIMSFIFLGTYYYNTQNNFNLTSYLLLASFILFFYYFLIATASNGGHVNKWTLFVTLPMLGSFFYIISYLTDYFNTFSEIC